MAEGRLDMALFKFAKAMIEGKCIDVCNYGKMKHNFIYIDDVAEAIFRLKDEILQPNAKRTVENGSREPASRYTVSMALATVPG